MVLLLYFFSLSSHFNSWAESAKIRIRNMDMKRKLSTILLLACILSGCEAIRPDPVTDMGTATVNPVTTLEYSIFVQREVGVFTNQILSQMALMRNMEKEEYELLSDSIDESICLMNEAYDSVYMETAPDTDQKEKEMLLDVMKKCLEHMKEYQTAIKENKDADEFKILLQNDFYALTAMTSTYTQ